MKEKFMKEKNIKIMFFTIIILILVFSICYIIKNKNTLVNDIKTNKTEEKISYNIIIGTTSFDTINPIISKNQDVQYISKLIYKPLINITEDFKLEPSLAEEWAKLDSKTYLIRLNSESTWQDGNEFTAKDVEYTLNYIKNQESIYKDNVKNIENIDIIDKNTIKIHLIQEENNFEYMLCFPIICERENVGLGEYKIESINETEIILKNTEKNKQILIRIYNTVGELYNAFNKEEVDIITTNNINYEEYIGKIGYNKHKIYGRNFDYIKFNLENNILKNPEIVQAIEYAVNKKEIIYKINNNNYLEAEFPLQYGSYLYNNEIEYEYNINKAQEILEEANWKYNRKILAKKWTILKFRNNDQQF